MCDYSLHGVKSRPAKIGDELVTHHFRTGTTGFAGKNKSDIAVCLRPGTELAFSSAVRWGLLGGLPFNHRKAANRKTAIFRQINANEERTHHDALEFSDGKIVLLTCLRPGQTATVLQLPAGTDKVEPKNSEMAE